jgi:hypothetical protein
MVLNRNLYQSTFFEKGESLSLGHSLIPYPQLTANVLLWGARQFAHPYQQIVMIFIYRLGFPPALFEVMFRPTIKNSTSFSAIGQCSTPFGTIHISSLYNSIFSSRN